MHYQGITGNSHPPSMLRRLRALAPERSLRLTEARNLAELQANRLLQLSGMRFAEPVPIEIVTDLPHISAEDDPMLPIAGASHWDDRRHSWVIRLNPTYSAAQRRLTLLHEFKHILDFRPNVATASSACDDRLAELVADHFAACVLLPKRAVRRAWGTTAFSAERLAAHFDVPESIARARLQQLGLGPSHRESPEPIEHLEAA